MGCCVTYFTFRFPHKFNIDSRHSKTTANRDCLDWMVCTLQLTQYPTNAVIFPTDVDLEEKTRSLASLYLSHCHASLLGTNRRLSRSTLLFIHTTVRVGCEESYLKEEEGNNDVVCATTSSSRKS